MGKAKSYTFQDHVRGKKQAITKRLPICMDPELADEWNQATTRVQLKELELRSKPQGDDLIRRELEDARAVVEQLRPQVEEATVVFTFRGLGRPRFEEILAEHKPTPAQLKEAREDGLPVQNFNIETFPIALIAASCSDPVMTVDDVKEIWNDEGWNDIELSNIFNAALECNQTHKVIDLGNA